jgi:hypothetical protein
MRADTAMMSGEAQEVKQYAAKAYIKVSNTGNDPSSYLFLSDFQSL